MGAAKALHVAPIDSRSARAFVRRHHYSGKVAMNSQLHLGAFLRDQCVGVAQFGPPLDRSKVLGLVRDTKWSGVLELNRLVMVDDTPRNTESRFLGVAMRMIRREAPWVEWVLSYADAAQCGDGTIYRASGFVLTMIKRTRNSATLPSGEVVHKMTLENGGGPARRRPELGGRSYFEITGGRYDFAAYCRAAGATPLGGFQLRYIRFLEPAARARLTVPEIPFTAIAEAGAGMYLGQARAGSIAVDAPAIHAGEGGSSPTPALQARL